MEGVFKHHDLQMFDLKLNKNNISNFHLIYIVDRDSQVQDNLAGKKLSLTAAVLTKNAHQ